MLSNKQTFIQKAIDLKKIVCQEIDIILFHACKNKDILIEFWFISKKQLYIFHPKSKELEKRAH